MASTPSVKPLPSNLFQTFVLYDGKGNLDVKKSVRSFEEAFTAWLKEQGDIKPAILAELQDHERLGEGKLTSFVMHRLRMKPTKENEDRIKQSLEELTNNGKIVYQTTESGQRRGRGAGYVLGGSERGASQ